MKFLKYPIFILLSSIAIHVNAQSVELDKMLGEENSKMVEAQMGIYQDVEKTDYFARIGNRLLANLKNKKFDYQFKIVPDAAPNAFALPGGYVFITTGLLPIFESEDELACVLAHELIHAHNRHSIKQLRKSVVPRLMELPGNLIGVINQDLGAVFNAPIQTSNALLFASYGRTFETEADVQGIQLAAASGYNPEAMIPILNRMSEAIEKATGRKEAKSYFNDHPYTPDRVKTIEDHASKIKWIQKSSTSDNFLMEFDSLLFGESPEKGVIRENQFLHPDLNFSIHFPLDWNIDNQPSNVGAYHPDRKAAVYVTLEDPTYSPEEAAKVFIENMESDYKKKMSASEKYTINGKEGYLLSFTEKVKHITMYAYVLWVPLEDKLFKMTGIAPIEYRPQLEETAKSLRVLKKKELTSFEVTLIRVVHANRGETIKSLSKRTNNVLNEELTGVINARNPEDKLNKGESIKIVKRYPYKVNK